MRLEGSLDAFSLPDIFALLSMTKKTGALHLRRADAHGVVRLRDGLVTGGASDRARESLGRRLAGSGRVSDRQLTEAVETVRQNREVGLARVLRDAGSIDEGELHALVSEHVVDTVFDLMRWSTGEFEFVIDEPDPDDVGIAREVDEVVSEVRRRLDTWVQIDAEVAASDTVLSLTRDPSADLQLVADEWELLSLVDGRRTVGEIVTICGRGEYGVVVALAELVNRGLVRVGESEGVAAMLRRQDLIATLEETPAAPVPEQAAAQPPVLTEVTADDDTDEAAAEADDEDGSDDEPVAEVAELVQPTAPRDLSAVTPQRPEPFLPPRTPDHPEPVAVAMAGGGSVTATAAAIERDPSVNKSLLLRLIAGVRGL